MSESSLSELLVNPGKPLTPADAVVAIITCGGRYVMQQRDAIRGIFFPGHWGLFGGAIEAGETEVDALVRELREELSLEIAPTTPRFFTKISFDCRFAGGPEVLLRSFYTVEISAADLERIKLGEGAAWAALAPEEAMDPTRPVTPYDAFAIWLHLSQASIVFPNS